eukprot:TRINITY_DN2530_c0_g1_i2.p1 TRINITY_DN2530_c0_g1~~TRINITY_DN2530_c0_g1_i2.p1  ORF type:complete len:749 (+),score=253.20 TRINITY_DN2530_c0_g1_i2:66-2249(+)
MPREAKTIQVYFRQRPPNSGEVARGENCNVLQVDEQDRNVVALGEKSKRYPFHGVFLRDSTQEQVFDAVAKNAVLDAFEGYIGLMFVYGQTGTGKTFTMSCQEPGLEGVFQRSMSMVFQKIKDDKSGDYTVSCTFIQIYQEIIQDLLSGKFKESEKKGLGIREDPDNPGLVYCHPLKSVELYRTGDSPESGEQNALQTFLKGDSNRSVACTKMNATSSRSHTVFTLKIERRNKLTDADYETDEQKEEFKGQLILVDLAGCERQKKTGVDGQGLGEANAINGSLLVLGKVIKALTDPKQFVPYRESKLTRLLQYPLSGKGRTTLIITAGPSEVNQDETRSAIEFGQRAMKIKANAQKHVEIDYKAAYLKLKAQMEAGVDEGHRQALLEQEERYKDVVEEKDERIKELEREVALRVPGGGGGGRGGGGAASDDGISNVTGAVSSSSSGEYEERYRQTTKELEVTRQERDEGKDKLRKKRLELAAQREKSTGLEKELLQKKTELESLRSDHMVLAFRMRKKVERLIDEKTEVDAELTQLRRGDLLGQPLTRDDFRSRDDVSDTGSDASLQSPRMSPEEPSLSPVVTSRHDDPGASAEDRIQELWEDKMLLGERLRDCMQKIQVLETWNKKMKTAIRYQAESGDAQGRLQKAEERAEKYRMALLTIQQRERGELSDHSREKDKKDKKERKHRREHTFDEDDVSGDDRDAAKKEKKEKKDKKAKDKKDKEEV